MSPHSRDDESHIALCEVLDRVLNKGVVVHGDVTISVADVDLLYLGLRLLLTSIETAAASGALAKNHGTLWRRNDGIG